MTQFNELPVRPLRERLIGYVKDYALTNYDKGGWDVIVECYDDDMIADVIGKARTPEGAIRKFRPLVSVWADRQADARNSAF